MPVTRAELLERLKLHEDSFVERKPEGTELLPSIVGFANAVPRGREAIIYVGVRDNGELIGISNADSYQKKLQRWCREYSYPPVAFTSELFELEGKTILAVVIPPSLSKPHFSGPAYIRQGNSTVVASERLFGDLIAARTTIGEELLRYRGGPITIASAKAQLGRPEHEQMRAGTSLSRQVQRYECTVIDVNPFFARFQLYNSQFSEPLANLVISYDDVEHRPMVIVRLDPQ